MGLATGFTSARICHLCSGHDSCLMCFSFFFFFWKFSEVPGLRVLRVELTKEWYNLGRNSEVRSLQPDAEFPTPFHADRPSPLRTIEPFGSDPRLILVDLAHCYAIKGWGKDDIASSIIFLTVRCGVFGWDGDYNQKLERAWMSFKAWRNNSKESTQLTDFSTQCLKITSTLV